MQAVAETLMKKWRGAARAHYTLEYCEQDMWSFDYLKQLGVLQQPNVKSASRAGVHTDEHYESIMATVDPRLIRTEEHVKAKQYVVNGLEMSPPMTTIAVDQKLVEYRAELTATAIGRALAAGL